jgi:hypothetical protein
MLHCVITLTEDVALKQAARADQELAAGEYRGPLDGIPYGIKDLFAVRDYRTTWGAAPFKDQIIDQDATVASKLEEAGAVLVAKLSSGELAVDDVWFGGQTPMAVRWGGHARRHEQDSYVAQSTTLSMGLLLHHFFQHFRVGHKSGSVT